MKLAVITPYWQSGLGGGINTFTRDLVSSLKKHSELNIKVGYIVGNDGKNYKINGGVISGVTSTYRVLKKIKPDIIQIHENWPLLFGCAIYKTLNKNVRLIFYPLTEPTLPSNIFKKIEHFFKILIYKWSFKQCDHVLIGCREFQKKIDRTFKLRTKEKEVFIPMAINIKEVTEEEIHEFKEKFNILDNSIKFLIQGFTANEIKMRGALLSLKVIKELLKDHPNIVLIMTREGMYSKFLKESVENFKINKNVIFTGDVENGFIPLKICDIFLWPWLGESGFGFALLEAMYEKKAIVATTVVGNLPPLINGKNAIVVEPTENGLYQGILKILDDKELAQKLGKEARKNIIENYTWEKAIRKYLELYYPSKCK